MQIADGLEWRHIYWVRGATPKSMAKNAVKDPPCAGWQHAFVLTGEKHSTIFCPYSFQAHTVPNACMELTSSKEPESYTIDFLHSMIKRKWVQFQSWGWQRDYDICTLILKRLGLEVPKQIRFGGEDDNRKRGGKDVRTTLTRPVKTNGKRGAFLRWFLEAEGQAQSIREAMVHFSMSRSNALSYLFMIQKDHGIGYTLIGDTATVQLPEDCTNPFDTPWPMVAEATIDANADDDDIEEDPQDPATIKNINRMVKEASPEVLTAFTQLLEPDGINDDPDDDSWLD